MNFLPPKKIVNWMWSVYVLRLLIATFLHVIMLRVIILHSMHSIADSLKEASVNAVSLFSVFAGGNLPSCQTSIPRLFSIYQKANVFLTADCSTIAQGSVWFGAPKRCFCQASETAGKTFSTLKYARFFFISLSVFSRWLRSNCLTMRCSLGHRICLRLLTFQ